jgi:solute carrier family 35 protein E1
MAPEWAWTAAWIQLALGFFLYIVPLWTSGTRRPPELTVSDIQRLVPVAMLHALVHVGGVVSMGAGAVSFTYIVKATEPAISAVLAALLLKSYLPLPVYLTLVPVIGGVSLASVSELSFTWKSFNYAMMSNLASASRGIVGKKTINQRVGKNLTAQNLYAIMTILATLVLLPLTALLEGPAWAPTVSRLISSGQWKRYGMTCLVASLTYYTYNEVSFMALDNINPVTHALASTLRRVFIILSSMVVFGNQMTIMGALGSGLAVVGAMLYSTTKQYYKERQQQQQQQAKEQS